MLTMLSPPEPSTAQTPPRRCPSTWSCPRRPSSPTSPCGCHHGCWLQAGGGGTWLSMTPSSPSSQDHRRCYLPWERQGEGSRQETVRKGCVPGQDSWLGQVSGVPPALGRMCGLQGLSEMQTTTANVISTALSPWLQQKVPMILPALSHIEVEARRLREGRGSPTGLDLSPRSRKGGLAQVCRAVSHPIQGLREEAGEIHSLRQRGCGQQGHL